MSCPRVDAANKDHHLVAGKLLDIVAEPFESGIDALDVADEVEEC